jgi:ADP-L-glycero-D-manno-heptose 6-epimerase
MYVITGGAGFIGSNIAAVMEEQGYENLVICDVLGSEDKWYNIAKRELYDIVHPDKLFEFLAAHESNVEGIIHMGAISATTETDADLIVENNFRMSMALWQWCTQHHASFIYASSAATYGDGAEGFDDDGSIGALAKLKPLNAYGWSKHLFDRRIARAIKNNNARPPHWAGLKFFNVYGPNEYHKEGQRSVAHQVFPIARDGGKMSLFKSHHPDYEDGGQLRDFVWVDDCVNIVLWLLENKDANGLFNCGTGQARSFLDLANSVYAAVGQEPDIDYVPAPEAIRNKYQYFTQANMTRIRDAGYDQPFTSLEDGIAAYVKKYLISDDSYR